MQKNETPLEKSPNFLAKATGLNQTDILKAITSPKKIAYIEEMLHAIERGDLKIRVCLLEDEKSSESVSLTQGKMENLLVASLIRKAR